MQRGRSAVSIADLIRAGLLQPGQSLSFRRSNVTAVVSGSGTLILEGVEYGSPSTAAKVAGGGSSTNGWIAWSVDSASGSQTLAALRDRYLNP